MNPFPQNSSVLVTGAAGGIGKSIAFLFAVHYKKLYLLDLDATKLTELESELLSRFPEISITLFAGSVCDNEFIDHCFSMIEADPYEFSAVIHCASILRGHSGPVSLVELPTSEWEAIIDINLTGSFLVSRRSLRSFLRSKLPADLLFIGSTNASNPRALDAPYVASKAAVIALAESLNEEMMRYGIRVQSLSPDAVDTPFWDQNNSVLPRPPAMLSPDTVAEMALQLVQLPRDGYIRNLQLYPIKSRKRKMKKPS